MDKNINTEYIEDVAYQLYLNDYILTQYDLNSNCFDEFDNGELIELDFSKIK